MNNNPIVNPIHNGDRIHHHDQSITPVSFKTMKTLVKTHIGIEQPKLILTDSSFISLFLIYPPTLLSTSSTVSGMYSAGIVAGRHSPHGVYKFSASPGSSYHIN